MHFFFPSNATIFIQYQFHIYMLFIQYLYDNYAYTIVYQPLILTYLKVVTDSCKTKIKKVQAIYTVITDYLQTIWILFKSFSETELKFFTEAKVFF